MKSSKIKKHNPKAKSKITKKQVKNITRIAFWFLIGALITVFLISSFSYLGFQYYYKDKIYPGVSINGVDFSKKTENEVKNYFTQKNKNLSDSKFIFNFEENTATVSAEEIGFGYDENLLTTQAMSIGRGSDPLTGASIILQSYLNGVNLSPAYKFSEDRLNEKLNTLFEKVNKEPVEAVFNFQDGRVAEFRASENGRQINAEELNKLIIAKGGNALNSPDQKVIFITIHTKVIKPNLTTEKVNKMGIKELIGVGTSLFQHSIESRIYNVGLGASRINGILVPPGEV